jgi:hypothetical protein
MKLLELITGQFGNNRRRQDHDDDISDKPCKLSRIKFFVNMKMQKAQEQIWSGTCDQRYKGDKGNVHLIKKNELLLMNTFNVPESQTERLRSCVTKFPHIKHIKRLMTYRPHVLSYHELILSYFIRDKPKCI